MVITPVVSPETNLGVHHIPERTAEGILWYPFPHTAQLGSRVTSCRKRRAHPLPTQRTVQQQM